MYSWNIRLFGKLSIQHNQVEWHRLEGCKVQELLCYLLLHRSSVHQRESLASLLWGESTTAQSKKNLRQALWHLQAYGEATPDDPRWLVTSTDQIQFNPTAQVQLDVAQFEQAYTQMQRQSDLDHETFSQVETAVNLYQGDLLVGWYQDWCLYERERLQNMYLTMVDKLIVTCEARQAYEQGINYCQRILQLDRARERAHRQMMRLFFLLGDRTAALRQFDKCVVALQEELNVRPMKNTQSLYEQICAGELCETGTTLSVLPNSNSLPEVLTHLKQLHLTLASLQQLIQQDIKTVEVSLAGQQKQN